MLESVEWGKLLQNREVRVMCSKSVTERSTVCTWCGNDQRARREIGAWSLTGYNLGMINYWEMKGGGDACVCFVCTDEKYVV